MDDSLGYYAWLREKVGEQVFLIPGGEHSYVIGVDFMTNQSRFRLVGGKLDHTHVLVKTPLLFLGREMKGLGVLLTLVSNFDYSFLMHWALFTKC